MKIRSLIMVLTIASLLAACTPKDASTQVPTLALEMTETMESREHTSIPAEVASATLASISSGNVFDIEISGFTFVQNTVTIKIGDTVNWINQDGATHTIVADDDSFKSSSLKNGNSFSHTFGIAGTYTYHCGIHSSMTGSVIVEP